MKAVDSRNYLTKAENSLRIARIALEQGAYDSAVVSSVHSAINSLDALTLRQPLEKDLPVSTQM